jgi:hypothetical protein
MMIQYLNRVLIAPRVRVTINHLLAAFQNDEALYVLLKGLRAFANNACLEFC